MKVISVIKKSRGEGGVSYAAHYVSTRDRDEEREGKEPRKLFSAGEGKLTASQANQLLGDGREVMTNDLIHVVVSLEKEEDFNRLGTDEESRRRGLRETMREAMDEMIDHFKAYDLRWAACIHRNTDNPHVHLLIHREYVDRETGAGKRLNALQRDLRLNWSTTPDGERVTNAGALSRAFEKYLERRIERAEEERRRNEHKMREERVALGRAMLAEDHVAHLREVRNAAIAYGERRRYKVIDASGRSRWLSEYDLRMKAGAAADRVMAGLSTYWNPEARRQMREGVFDGELEKYKPVIKMIRKMRGADLDRAELKLRQAMETSRPPIDKARAIRRQYESAGLTVPVPILSREEVSRLQDRAIQRGDAGRLRELEVIRVSLAAENGLPARTDREVGRLQAKLFVARSSLIAERHSSQITRKAEVVNMLGEILAREESQYRKDWRRMPEPVFTEQEMKELAAQAERRGDPEFYRELIKLERDFDARINHFSWVVNPDRVSRAKAREVMAEISARESQLGLQRFNDQRGQMTVMAPLIERSEKDRHVASAVEDYGDRLRRLCEQASAIHAVLKEAAMEYEAEFARQNPEKPAPPPRFTAGEIDKLKLHAWKETDPKLRARYEKLLSESLAASRDDSESRAPSDIRQTIVLDNREAVNIFDSAVTENYARDFEDRSSSQVDRAAMSFEK